MPDELYTVEHSKSHPCTLFDPEGNWTLIDGQLRIFSLRKEAVSSCRQRWRKLPLATALLVVVGGGVQQQQQQQHNALLTLEPQCPAKPAIHSNACGNFNAAAAQVGRGTALFCNLCWPWVDELLGTPIPVHTLYRAIQVTAALRYY